MAKWTPGQLSMFPLMTSEASPNATSSQALADGLMRSASPGGPMTDRSGPAPAPVSRSRSQAKAPVQTIQGTSGPTSTASSPPADPLSSWESKLQQRLASLGSTECSLTWKGSVTPQGRPLFRLVPSMPHIVGIDSGFWPTPSSRDGKGGYQGGRIRNGRLSNDTLDVTVQHTGRVQNGLKGETLNQGGMNPQFVCWLMGFPPEWESYAPTATPSSRKSRQK